jgi:two-component system, OmpR family, sensor histidine kinase TctE
MGMVASENPEAPRVSQSTYLKTSFLEALAHELRGPSGVTLGALDELELALGEAAQAHASLFAMARRGVRRVLRTTDRLSRSAQLELSGLSPTLEQTDLSALVERAARDAELVEARRGVKLDITRPAEPVMARVDATWLSAALSEVVAAGLRAAKRSVMVELQQSGDSHRVIICDDGPITSLPRLRRFEPSDDRRDAGLAFPMVKEVIDAHRGELSLKNGETAGLLCVISLPAS